MRYRISRYFISLLILLLSATFAEGQQRTYSQSRSMNRRGMSTPKKKKTEGAHIIAPLYNGIYVGVDAFGPANSLLGSDFFSTEVQAGINLKNRFMPTIELGYGTTDTWNENGIHYKTNAPYGRVGIDYNFRFKKLDYEDWLFAGVRYGYTNFKYDMEVAPINDKSYGNIVGNPTMIDPIWGGSVPYKKTGMKGSMSWYELVFGIRTKIYKNFLMGLSLRFRYKVSATMDETAHLWYVPGFGKFDSKSTGITYTLIYKFSAGTKKPTVVNAPEEKEDDKPKVKFARKPQGGTPFKTK
jgi:hypothetical protein